MRVLVPLLALVITPFLASVSQEPPGRSPCWTVEHGAARDTHSQGHGNHWAWGHEKHACAPPVGDGGGGSGSGGTGGGTGGSNGGGTRGGGGTGRVAPIGGGCLPKGEGHPGMRDWVGEAAFPPKVSDVVF